MPCNTWILLLLLTVVLFWGQLSSTVPDGTLKKRPEGMSYSELHQSLVGVLSQHCWCSCLLPAEAEMKLHSICLCSHLKSMWHWPYTASGYHIAGWIALLKPLPLFLTDAPYDEYWILRIWTLLQVPRAAGAEWHMLPWEMWFMKVSWTVYVTGKASNCMSIYSMAYVGSDPSLPLAVLPASGPGVKLPLKFPARLPLWSFNFQCGPEKHTHIQV